MSSPPDVPIMKGTNDATTSNTATNNNGARGSTGINLNMVQWTDSDEDDDGKNVCGVSGMPM
jgi:hypothetical protein